jgi:hypothetical protein
MQKKWYLAGLALCLLLFPGCTTSTATVAAGAEGSTVEGWTGTVVKLPPGNQFGEYFQREDGQRYGIGTTDDSLRELVQTAAYSGQAIRVWGQLHPGVPATDSRYIDVERVDVLAEELVEPRNLSPWASVSASSYLPADQWGQYGPMLAIDGQLETSWVEGVDGPGTGQWLMLSFPSKVQVHSIALDVGYDADADLFLKNNRIKKVTLLFSTGESLSLSFADKRGLQSVPLVRAPGPNIETTFVKLVIDEVYLGSQYNDTCLAEVEVWGRTLPDCGQGISVGRGAPPGKLPIGHRARGSLLAGATLVLLLFDSRL